MSCYFLSKKHTDTLIKQTRTQPQETLEFKINRQREAFPFSPPLNSIDEGKWLLGVTSFECTNSVFKITNKNSSFSITIPRYWSSTGGAETFNKLQQLIKPR